MHICDRRFTIVHDTPNFPQCPNFNWLASEALDEHVVEEALEQGKHDLPADRNDEDQLLIGIDASLVANNCEVGTLASLHEQVGDDGINPVFIKVQSVERLYP